jgi:acetylornithine deacetylase/succinyl-diaminopimelate desuccinylase-like protein
MIELQYKPIFTGETMNPKLNSAIKFAHKNYKNIISDLSEFLRIKTISADSTYSKDMVLGAQWLVNYLKSLGAIETRILKTQKHPVVFGNLSIAGKHKPTILIYGHYDVQPVDPIDLWKSDPFEPTIKNNLLYSRGSSDMKGQMMVVLGAIKSIIGVDKLPVNLKFMFEGEEEIGSPSIKTFLKEHKELFKSDFVLNLDAGMISKDKPTIVYGLRGLAYFEIHITGPAQDLHSGLFGGVVYNPIQALSEIISQLKDSNGVIQLPGFYDDVIPLSREEKIALDKLGMDDKFYKDQTGVKKLYGEKGYTATERIGARPTLDINGISGGYTGEGPKTVIPSKAMAKLSMRLVPNQTPLKVKKQLLEFLGKNAPKEIKWELKMLASDPASLTEMNFYGTQCFAQAIREIWDIPPVYQRGGGSIPIVSHMQKILGLESVLSGFSLPEDNIHSPNERLDLDVFKKGIDTTINFFYNIAEQNEK